MDNRRLLSVQSLKSQNILKGDGIALKNTNYVGGFPNLFTDEMKAIAIKIGEIKIVKDSGLSKYMDDIDIPLGDKMKSGVYDIFYVLHSRTLEDFCVDFIRNGVGYIKDDELHPFVKENIGSWSTDSSGFNIGRESTIKKYYD